LYYIDEFMLIFVVETFVVELYCWYCWSRMWFIDRFCFAFFIFW